METATLMSGIYISDKAKSRVEQLLSEEGRGSDHFVRVSVVSGGCSGLTYKMDFDNEILKRLIEQNELQKKLNDLNTPKN